MTNGTVSAALAVSLVLGAALPLAAADLASPSGEIILTVGGAISTVNGDGVAQFDRPLLDSLPQHSFATSTIWTETTNTYRGVLLKDLLAAVGAQGTTVRVTALNDYRISFPVAEIAEDGPLVAYMTDGRPMTVRDTGPVWLIYPFEANSAYRTEETYARSIWQMTRIDVTE